LSGDPPSRGIRKVWFQRQGEYPTVKDHARTVRDRGGELLGEDPHWGGMKGKFPKGWVSVFM
jgi:hypothetical protein